MPPDSRPRLLEGHRRKLTLAKRVTAIGMAVCASLASAKLLVGWMAHSTAVFADGLENIGDLFGSGLVLYALYVASKLPDKEHPYGHGRHSLLYPKGQDQARGRLQARKLWLLS
jgi:divalent metal cation (Fe/Co/Zn/Cd) transporter